MRKEQLLLVAAIAVGGLVVWSATGRYTEVGASTLPDGKDVPIIEASQPDLVKGLKPEPLKGRALSAQKRMEKRPPLPDIPAIPALPVYWVRPVPAPGPNPGHWKPLRTSIVPVKVEEPKAPSGATPPDDPGQAPADQPTTGAVKKEFDLTKCAKLVRASGEEINVILEPSGAFKGQPDWVILEKWPNVSFYASQLNNDGSPIGRNELVGPDGLAGYATVRLMKTLENEFHEERIGRRVKDNDPEALEKFGRWVHDTLKDHSAADKVKYGVRAVRMAVEVIRNARKARNDLAMTRLLGDYCREAYDLEGELQVFIDYLKEHPNDNGAYLLAGDAYERFGAISKARELFAKASETGDPEAKLRFALILEKEKDATGAMDKLRELTGVPKIGARALTAMARICLVLGRTDEANGYAQQAVKEGATPQLARVMAGIQYVQGKFAEAEKTYAASKEDDRHSDWRSDRGMALLAAGKLDEAAKEFQACLDEDPLNLLDPLFGLGEVAQRHDQQKSVDYFETALARSPDNAWILLRLGKIRLRDGQPEKALALGEKLLSVDPSCVDGLWLVGRSAATLEKTDYAKAASNLRRAVVKEPDNREFLHEYARILVLSNHTEEAIRELEAATEVKAGFARTDGRLIGLLAWAQFLAKKDVSTVVQPTIQRGLRATLDEETKKWLEQVKSLIVEWDNTRFWEDDFQRPAAQIVGNGWEEKDQALGVAISLDGAGHVIFRSQAVKEAAPTRDGATRLWHEDDLGKFKQIEGTFKAQAGVEMWFHLFMGPLDERNSTGGGRGRGGGIELGLGCDRNGNMLLWQSTAKGNDKAIAIKDAAGNPRPWPMEDSHTVRFVRKDPLRGVYEVWFDDEKITVGPAEKPQSTFEIGGLSAQTGRKFSFGFLVDSDGGQQVDVSVDYVKLIKNK